MNHSLWEGVDQDKVLTTMANAIMGLRTSRARETADEDYASNDEEEEEENNNDEEENNDDEDVEEEEEVMTNVVNPVGIHLQISDNFSVQDLEAFRAVLCGTLTGTAVAVIVRNQSTAHILTGKEARAITTVFFKDMVGTTLSRVAAVVAEVEDYNLSIRAARLGDDEDIPAALRAVYTTLAALKFGGGGISIIQNIEYHLTLVDFHTNWDYVKACISQGGAEGRQILRYMPPATRGARKVSHAKAAICEKLGLTSAKLDTLHKASHIAAAMVTTFGKGAVMYLPIGVSG